MEKPGRGWSRGRIAVLCMLGIDLESPAEIHGVSFTAQWTIKKKVILDAD